jgi:hypothetical protein
LHATAHSPVGEMPAKPSGHAPPLAVLRVSAGRPNSTVTVTSTTCTAGSTSSIISACLRDGIAGQKRLSQPCMFGTEDTGAPWVGSLRRRGIKRAWRWTLSRSHALGCFWTVLFRSINRTVAKRHRSGADRYISLWIVVYLLRFLSGTTHATHTTHATTGNPTKRTWVRARADNRTSCDAPRCGHVGVRMHSRRRRRRPSR